MNTAARITALVAAAAFSLAAIAQPATERSGPEIMAESSRLAAEAAQAFNTGDLKRSEELLREQIELQPANFVPWYNLACCLAQQGRVDEGIEALRAAIERGFTDARQLRTDRTLGGIRQRPEFKAILEAWPELLDAQADFLTQKAQDTFTTGYTTLRDPSLRLIYHSAFNARAGELAREELDLIAKWADEHLMPGILDDQKMREDAWVIVVLPTRTDFARWAVGLYGPQVMDGISGIGGSYEHDGKRLVAMDLGGTLRHEFFHVLHWRDMTRRGQQHAIWIQEGLGTLIEDYDITREGNLKPALSWRTNTAKRMLRVNAIVPLRTLAGVSQERFTAARPLGNYAHARAFFLYLHQTNKLKAFYTTYVNEFDADPTGLHALEAAFGLTIDEIDQDFRRWLRMLPEAAERIESGMASLGIEVDTGAGEGPIVTRAPASIPLRAGDVITAIDGRPVRDIAELVRLLGRYKPGDVVEVSFRRGRMHSETRITLTRR